MEGCHRFALAFKNVSNRVVNGLLIPQSPRTPVTRPPLTITSVETELIKASARSEFQLGHNELRLFLSGHDDMHVIASNMDSDYTPVTLIAPVNDRFQYRAALWFVQLIRGAAHQLTLGR